ncbi:hypothetical protein SESBI_34630 [Sesbania bispinosa]|nr:hypothetical protein SESBI_34630 [Sesbania bispinosa]
MARGRRSRRRATENPQDASITPIEGLTRALNQQNIVLSVLLGESERTLLVGQAALVAPRSDHQASRFLDLWLCHPPIFEGGLDRSSASTWLREIEEILDDKGSLMLRGEAELWWRGIQGRVVDLDTPIT